MPKSVRRVLLANERRHRPAPPAASPGAAHTVDMPSTLLAPAVATEDPAVIEGRRIVTAGRRHSGRIPYPAAAPFPAPVPELRPFHSVWAVSALGGLVGADRFLIGRPYSGALKLITAGGAGLWWLSDMLAIATGRTTDGAGHPLSGRTGARVAAVAATLGLAISLGAAAAPLAAPGIGLIFGKVTEVSGQIREVVDPEEVPAPKWSEAAYLQGEASGTSRVFTISGTAARITYQVDGHAFVYLHPAGTGIEDGIGEQWALERPSSGLWSVPLDPGTYVFTVQTGQNEWTFNVEEYDGPVSVDK